MAQISRRTRFNNAAITGPGTGQALGAGDRTAGHTVSLSSGNPYFFSDFVTRWRLYVGLYQTSWEARKIIRIVPEDALRKEWVAENIPEEIAKIISLRLKQLNFNKVLKRSLMLERLLGGCLTFFGLEGKEDKPDIPYKLSEGAKLRFVNPIPISRIARMTWENNPLSRYYMRPHKFSINHQEVHVSRLLIWDGDPLFDPYDYSLNNFRSNLAGFGPSKLAPIWDDIIKAVGTRQAAYQLIQTNNAIIMAVDNLQDLQGTPNGQQALQLVKNVANQVSLYRAAVIDGQNVQMKNKPASFGSVPELLMTFIQILSAASDIPATRFIGQAPGGLNATGESDLENYYNVIDSYQTQEIEPKLRTTYDIVGYHEFPNKWPKERENLTFEFPPLWNASELEEAQTHSLNIDNALKLFEQGMLSEKRMLEEINAKKALSVELDEEDMELAQSTGLGMDDPNSVNAQEEFKRLALETEGSPSPPTASPPSVPQQQGKTPPTVPQVSTPLKNKYWNGLDLGTDREVINLIDLAGGSAHDVLVDQFSKGMKVESEHGGTLRWNKITTAKIVLDHLEEYSDYYDRLEKIENQIPLNKLLEPTEKQKESGNYKKHHIKVQGLDISIENPQGSMRKSKDKDEQPWEVKMPAHYGYLKRTKGADGDQVDVFVGPEEDSELVFIVDQQNLDTKEFDEHKCILGTLSMVQAKELYVKSYSDGKGMERIKDITPVYMEDFKKWMEQGETKKPYSNLCGKESRRTKK